MNQLFKYHLLLAFLFITSSVISQNYTLSYQVLDNEEGLLGSRIVSYYEDNDGFVWLATLRGIARYDGHDYKWFTESNSNLRGLPEKNTFVEDDEGFLWVASLDKIDLINTRTHEIIPLEEKIGQSLPFKGAISFIGQTDDHHIIIKSFQNKKWYRYHSSSGLEELTFLNKIQQRKTQIKKDEIWFFSRTNTLVGYNLLTEQKIYEFAFPPNTIVLPIHNYNGTRRLFWTSDFKSIQIIEIIDGKVEILGQFSSEKSLRRNAQFITYLPQNDLFITNLNREKNGLSIIDIEQERLIPLSDGKDERILKLMYGWTDSQGIIWGRSKKSPILIQVNDTKFQHYATKRQHRGLKIMENHLFTGDLKMSLDNSSNISERPKLGIIVGVEQNIKDELWFGNSMIGQIDIETNTFKKVMTSDRENPRFWTIVRDKRGKWWTGSYFEGLYTSNFPKNDSLIEYRQYNEFDELKNLRINHLLEDGEYIWVSSPIGLYLLHKEKGMVRKFNAESEKRFRLPANHVHFLHKDKSNTYWLATSSEGLIRFKINEQLEVTASKKFSTTDGLSSNVLYCIMEDDNNRLWISSINGLSCLDKKTEQIQAFYKEDGIYELEFNRNSYTKTEDGRLFFGSIRGITAFHPDDIVRNDDYNFPIYLTQFATFKEENNELIDQTQEALAAKKIILQPSDRFFRLNVAMPDFIHSKKIRYHYKIEGLFNEFQPIESNVIEIGRLPYGRYMLLIRGQGADKRFSKQELKMPLIVIRPFYLRWWFILSVFILVCVTFYQAYQWRVRQLEERKRELELLVQERTMQIQKDKAIIEKDKAIIEEQAVQLKELDELKSKFFANISHELRTPLTLLLAPMDNIFKSKELSNKNYTYLAMMRQNGQKLLKRINELLDLSRLDANRLEVNERPVFLYPFFKTLLSTFESSANLKGIQLLFKYELDENIQVKLDDDKVEKIVSNYLSNALKFTPKQGEIELTISKKSNQLLISVRDTGIGILPNDLIKIFDRFYQARKDAAMQRLNGTGIGLSLCRELAKVLEGRVWATSEMDKGSIFYLKLPLVETFAQKEAILEDANLIETPILPKETIISTAQKFRPNILIVEDNPDLRTYLSMVLEDDYNVIAVENGKEAMERLTANGERQTANNTPIQDRQPSAVRRQPSLIISDIMMPVMDGIELLTKVKTTQNLQHIPMIMLTARQSLDVKIEALRIGVDDYLTKPFKDEELKARVANLIGNSQKRTPELEQNTTNHPTNSKKAITKVDYKWLSQIEKIILDNIENSQFKMTDLAATMSISYSSLKLKIKKITGLTPKQYERNIKLHQARQLFKSGQVKTVSEVMYQLGFENLSHFSKIYKQAFGVLPSEELNQ